MRSRHVTDLEPVVDAIKAHEREDLGLRGCDARLAPVQVGVNDVGVLGGELLDMVEAVPHRHEAGGLAEVVQPVLGLGHPKRRIDEGMVLLGRAEIPVPALIAAVLDRVVTETRRITGGHVPPVVLTHPAGWGAQRRSVLTGAAAAAGIVAPTLVPEPVAAGSYYVRVADTGMPPGRYAVVYDLGGGTFDASVLRRTVHGFDVVASEGLPDAGGLDVDAAIMSHLGAVYAPRDPEVWRQLTRPATAPERRAHRLLWEDVRTGKEMLSRTASTLIHIPLLEIDAPLGREQVDHLAEPIVQRTVAATRAVLNAAGVDLAQVSGVFLVGGASRLPLVATALHRGLGIAPTVIEQPELVVAEGSLHAPGRPSDAPAQWTPGPPSTPATPASTDDARSSVESATEPTPDRAPFDVSAPQATGPASAPPTYAPPEAAQPGSGAVRTGPVRTGQSVTGPSVPVSPGPSCPCPGCRRPLGCNRFRLRRWSRFPGRRGRLGTGALPYARSSCGRHK